MPEARDLPMIYDREISSEAPSARTVRFAERLEVAISWDCSGCDLDVFARPHDGADVIYFGAPTSAEGRLFKDFTRSPSLSNGLETIAFGEPVDLNQLRLAVNFYGGDVGSEGVKGEIRIAIGARTWASAFVIPAETGNGGEGAATVMTGGVAPNDNWVVIDPIVVTGAR